MNTLHCMLDIETLGTRPGDTILSIGAVLFTVPDGISNKFYKTISITDSKEMKFTAQKSTIEWWQKQEKTVREEAFSGTLCVKDVLLQFKEWLPEDTRVWGNGANFDNALLGAAYRLLGQEQPWKFWNDRCYRTVQALHLKDRIERVGKEHHALDDAETQALRLIHIANKIDLELR